VSNWQRANYRQVIELLQDDKLVWSPDFDNIRKALADVFEDHLLDDNFGSGTLNYLAEKLLAEENDLTV
jgi:Holliday junction resolvase RusA-like endonuclease